MTSQRYVDSFRTTLLPATLNSYSAIFFSKNKILGSAIMLVTFFNFFAGLSGLIAVLVTLLIANAMGFDKMQLKNGIYSFNALLTGIGMGTFFDPGYVFFSLLLLAALLTLILSVTLGGWLGKYGLPFLSIPFVVAFWFVVLPSSQFENLGLTQRNIFWMNEMYAIGGKPMLDFFQTIDALPIHKMLDIYLRSMSSIFFQNNLIAGLIITVTVLISSRIAFSLSIVGFLSAYLFAQFSGSDAASITYYNIGANYIMVAIAIGGFFIIPSGYSYLWSILLVPLTSLVLLFMIKLLGYIQLPVFSLPFSFVVILFVYFLKLRLNSSKLKLTPIQYYSPEINLYTFKNNQDRLAQFLYFPLYLPFWGEWSVTQGHDGQYTHKGDWGKALDFMIFDDKMRTYRSNGLLCENYYCYNKPVLAPADGIVEEVVDTIDDNEIGKVNTSNNWGNSIIIRHLPGLYTQISHLKRGSFKVAKGDYVKRGDLLAACGNSGRSPEPHLHFQVQTTPMLGAKTIYYPFAYFHQNGKTEKELHQFLVPAEGVNVSGISGNAMLQSAFDLMPDTSLTYSYTNGKDIAITEKWEAYTDAYNNKYLYCKTSESVAYFVNDGSMFYFTAFYGDKKSLLYYFYLSAYKVFLMNPDAVAIKDAMPLNTVRNKKIRIWLHDFIAPFYTYIKAGYSIKVASMDTFSGSGMIILHSEIDISLWGKTNSESNSTITVQDNCIKEFSFESTDTQIKATCINS
ncbi:MAG: urea transporter [Bacteroidales bacterium]|nr:urea transporter [Bacteroidales bacterium]